MVCRLKTFKCANREDAERQFNRWSLDADRKTTPAQQTGYFKVITMCAVLIDDEATIGVIYDTDIDDIQ